MKKYYKKAKLVIVLGGILLFTSLIYLYTRLKEHFVDRPDVPNVPDLPAIPSVELERKRTIIFLTGEQTANFLRLDKDAYVKKMSKADLFARQAKTSDDYIKIITKCTRELTFTPDETEKLIKCTRQADDFLMQSTYLIDGKLVAKIPWKLALSCDAYEEGLPHTRDDIIFLSRETIKQTDEQLVSTLIHEKVHIFQRQNKLYMDRLLQTLGYKESIYPSSDARFALRRSNPDITDVIYVNPETNKEMVFLYKTDKPESIDAVYQDQFIEHPYEKMAYDIANRYLQGYLRGLVKQL